MASRQLLAKYPSLPVILIDHIGTLIRRIVSDSNRCPTILRAHQTVTLPPASSPASYLHVRRPLSATATPIGDQGSHDLTPTPQARRAAFVVTGQGSSGSRRDQSAGRQTPTSRLNPTTAPPSRRRRGRVRGGVTLTLGLGVCKAGSGSGLGPGVCGSYQEEGCVLIRSCLSSKAAEDHP